MAILHNTKNAKQEISKGNRDMKTADKKNGLYSSGEIKPKVATFEMKWIIKDSFLFVQEKGWAK